MTEDSSAAAGWAASVPDLRARLVRRARRLGVDAESAEDLAQETLFEAWRRRDRLHDPSGFDRWLFAIFGNVYLRWRQRQDRDPARLDGDPEGDGVRARESGGFDVEVELDRRELADLLDRALAALPAQTRDVLVQRFVEERPVREVADRLGVTPGAVQMRVQRGKLALHKALTTDYSEDAQAFGLIDNADVGWQETRIWCPACGLAPSWGRFTGPHRRFELRCWHCHEIYIMQDETVSYGVTGFRSTLKRVEPESYAFWSGMAGVDTHPHRFTLRREVFESGIDYVGATCAECGVNVGATLDVQALWTPEGRRFKQEHPRIRRVGYERIEAGGVPAVVTSYESVTGAARLDVVLTRDRFDLVRSCRS